MDNKESKKYPFRKLYFKCEDNEILKPNVMMTNAYQRRSDAEATIIKRDTHYLWEDKTKPVPVTAVHGFYIVHDSLFDTLIKPHYREPGDK